jgi:hypothetical protein
MCVMIIKEAGSDVPASSFKEVQLNLDRMKSFFIRGLSFKAEAGFILHPCPNPARSPPGFSLLPAR